MVGGRQFKTGKCPTDDLAVTNRAIVNPADFPDPGCKHIELKNTIGSFLFTIERSNETPRGVIGFALLQRKWAQLSLNQEVIVEDFASDQRKLYVSSLVVEADFFQKKSAVQDPFDSDAMAREFTMLFCSQIFTVGQILPFTFNQKVLVITVKELYLVPEDVLNTSKNAQPQKSKYGILFSNSTVVFEKAPDSSLHLIGKSKGKTAHQSIINPEWDFAKLGVGGLDKEFNAIFRRAFASRVFPPEVVQQLGCKHVKGILLFGPPGTGKTLMARQIGKMLNAREPKIVNGPQILDKYVGESEANIRRLFADAEEEEKRLGVNSGLHIIIFDEIDAICKARGSVAGASGVHDTVVNQLLSKIDGVDQLNNILVIGMTNRRDMIDEALLRPGRLEVQMEIGLPNEQGRVQILNIHTARMKEYKKLSDDVNIEELATLTKNFSGAELEGLVRAAQSSALNRHVKAASKVEIDPDAAEKLLVTREDFQYALENDIKPAFGTASELVDQFQSRGITIWSENIRHIIEDGKLLTQLAKSPEAGGLVSVLLEGAPNAGKTALAAYLAKASDFPFVKVCSSEEMVGFSETAKCLAIRKYFDDAYRSQLSCILVDNIERLLDYGPIGPRYSNLTLQALLVLLKKEPPKGRKLLIICTTSRRSVLEELEMMSVFTAVLHVPNIRRGEEVATVLDNSEVFSKEDIKKIRKEIGQRRLSVGIKKLLALLDLVRQAEPQDRARKFVSLLEEQEILEIRADER